MISNPSAFKDYQILEKIEAGIALYGFEAKAIRSGRGSLQGSRVAFLASGAHLVNATIPPYQEKNAPKDYVPDRTRQLLLHKSQISRLREGAREKGKTVIPVSFSTGKKVKLIIALAKGLKKYEKREKIKKREFERERQKVLKHRA